MNLSSLKKKDPAVFLHARGMSADARQFDSTLLIERFLLRFEVANATNVLGDPHYHSFLC
jgi:hypothetical protein